MRTSSNMFKFVSVGEVAETTVQLLSLSLRDTSSQGAENSGIEQVEQLVFQQARDYLSTVREGFVISLRSSDIPDTYELRYLLDRILLDWDALNDELGLDVESSSPFMDDNLASEASAKQPLPAEATQLDSAEPLVPVREQLLAFGMAAVALGALPGLPSEQITFPHSYNNPPTYADISAPSSPAEMLIRIEELEEMIWQMMASHPGTLVQNQYGPVRRTYGFFETSAWLVRQEAERFGIKKNRSEGLTFF